MMPAHTSCRIIRNNWTGTVHAAKFVIDFSLEGMVATHSARPYDRWPGVDRLEPALDVRERGKRVIATREHEACTVDPAPGRNVGDRI